MACGHVARRWWSAPPCEPSCPRLKDLALVGLLRPGRGSAQVRMNLRHRPRRRRLGGSAFLEQTYRAASHRRARFVLDIRARCAYVVASDLRSLLVDRAAKIDGSDRPRLPEYVASGAETGASSELNARGGNDSGGSPLRSAGSWAELPPRWAMCGTGRAILDVRLSVWAAQRRTDGLWRQGRAGPDVGGPARPARPRARNVRHTGASGPLSRPGSPTRKGPSMDIWIRCGPDAICQDPRGDDRARPARCAVAWAELGRNQPGRTGMRAARRGG